MKTKFKQWCSTIPPISIIFHLKSARTDIRIVLYINVPLFDYYFTFFNFIVSVVNSPNHEWLHLGHSFLACLCLYIILCRIDAIGVTPIPAPINTACSVVNIPLVAVLYGPSIKHWKEETGKRVVRIHRKLKIEKHQLHQEPKELSEYIEN